MIYAVHNTYIFTEKEATLGLHQLGVRFLADSNSWNGNRTANLRTVRWMLKNITPSQLASDNVLVQPSARFSVGLLRSNFQVPNFLFPYIW